MGFGVRQAGDDGVAAYRIPGLVTSNKGTLLAVYDVRHNSSVDLQEYIEIGLSRSTDGGQTWEKMRIWWTAQGTEWCGRSGHPGRQTDRYYLDHGSLDTRYG